MKTAVCFLLLHLIVCVLSTITAQKKGMIIERYMLPAVWLIPVCGVLCAWIAGGGVRLRKRFRKIEAEKFSLEDNIYKDITQEDRADGQNSVIPLEDALLLNQSEIRRSLIMNLLNDNPGEYVDLLRQARMNDDTEVVHYAVTAMAELSKEYDIKMKRLAEICREEPDNTDAREELEQILKNYLDLGLAEGQRRQVILNQYEGLLESRLKHEEKLSVFTELVWVLLQERKLERCCQVTEIMRQQWPEKEESWIASLNYCTAAGDGKKIQTLIEEITEKQIYISQEGRRVIEFWRQPQEEEQ